ncbi:M48 family metalloprotease [Paraburkholderia oxyphila]|uniref:M48 family metalloprotease n=1 Tax=Paraburkholderia oxyphila TaxID=614212 RepID=UPI00048946E8|nr:M48 family metalloprotease [Paraburkholderia oxyphila]
MPLSQSSDTEIFRREIARFGLPLIREEVPPRGRAYYDEIAEQAEDLIAQARHAVEGLPPIYFDFIRNPQVNAVAFRAGNRYFIGVYTGLLFMLRMVIGRMLADSKVFPSIGDTTQERNDLEPLQSYVMNADSMNQTNALSSPRDGLRWAYAHFLTHQAIMFFVGHEITHISRGHVDYLLEKRDVRYSSESSGSPRDDEELRLERQCLEQDADRRSIIARMSSLRVTLDRHDSAPLPWAPKADATWHLLRDWNVSLSILFRLFGDIRFSRSDLTEANYPPLPIRRLYSEVVASWEVQKKWPRGMKIPVSDAFNEGRTEAELGFATILGEPLSMAGVELAKTKVARKHAMDLQEYWNKIVIDRVRPYSYEF